MPMRHLGALRPLIHTVLRRREALRCPRCGRKNRPSAPYCTQCGTELGPLKAAACWVRSGMTQALAFLTVIVLGAALLAWYHHHLPVSARVKWIALRGNRSGGYVINATPGPLPDVTVEAWRRSKRFRGSPPVDFVISRIDGELQPGQARLFTFELPHWAIRRVLVRSGGRELRVVEEDEHTPDPQLAVE